MKLPVCKVAPMAPADKIRDIGRGIFPREDKIIERVTKVELNNKVGKIEVDVGQDVDWASEKTRVWRCEPTID